MIRKTNFVSTSSPVDSTAGVFFLIQKYMEIELLDLVDTNIISLRNIAALPTDILLAMGNNIEGQTIYLKVTLKPNESAKLLMPTGNFNSLTITTNNDVMLLGVDHFTYTDDVFIQPLHPTFSLGSYSTYVHKGYQVEMNPKSYIQLRKARDCEVVKLGMVYNSPVTLQLGRFTYTISGYCNLLIPKEFLTELTISTSNLRAVGRLTISGQRSIPTASHMQQWSV